MRRKRILSQKRPDAGGEARERASFLQIQAKESGPVVSDTRKYPREKPS